jgi:hypothetical protein
MAKRQSVLSEDEVARLQRAEAEPRDAPGTKKAPIVHAPKQAKTEVVTGNSQRMTHLLTRLRSWLERTTKAPTDLRPKSWVYRIQPGQIIFARRRG